MSLHKSPLQILQSLTQKKFTESKKEKTVFPAASDIYLGKNNKISSSANSDMFAVKKNTIGNYMKGSNIDVNTALINQSEPRAKSPIRLKKTIAKGGFVEFEKIQIGTGERPSTGMKGVVKDSNIISNGDTSLMEKKTNDQDINELVKSKLELAYNDYQQEDYNSALNKLLKAEDYIEKTLNNQTQLSFGTIHLVFYNLISTEYKLRALADCKMHLNNSLLNCHVLKEQKSHKGPLANFRNLQEQSEYLKHVASKSLQKKYRCKMHLQACLIHSEIENHIEAYAHAKQASKLACHLLTDTLMICYHLYLKAKGSKSPFSQNQLDLKVTSTADTKKGSFTDLISASTHPFVTPSFQQAKPPAQGSKGQLQQNPVIQTSETEPDEKAEASLSEAQIQHLENIIPILEDMVYKVKGRKIFNGMEIQSNDSTKKKLMYELRKHFMNHEFGKADMNKLYGGLSDNHFLYNVNIMGVAQIQPINPSEFNENWTMLDAIKSDTLIEEVLLMVVSLYALSTELRFWDDVIKRETPQKIAICELMTEYLPLSFLKRESQLWIGRSLEFAYTFLPHHCPIAEQIFSIYSKLYNPTKFMIPEDEEIKQQVKYLNPAKGITRSSFFFIPIIRKCENEEDDGIATLLFTEKELDNSLSKAIKQIQLFDVRSKYNDLLVKNYSNLQLRRDSRDTQLNFYNKINKLLKVSEKPQSSKGVHLRKTYINKSPMPKEEKSNTSGSEFLIVEDRDQSSLSRENNSIMAKKLPLKRYSDSPQPFSGARPNSKGGLPQSEPKSPVVRKSKDKIEYTLPDASRRDSLAETSKEEKSKTFMETYNSSKVFFRPSSSGMQISSSDNSKQSFINANSKTNQSSTVYVLQNQESSTVEDTLLVKDVSARQYNSEPKDMLPSQKRGFRASPEGKVRVLHRRVNGGPNREYFSHTEAIKMDNFMTNQDTTNIDKVPFESSMVVMTEPNERSTSQENERYVKKYIIPEKGPIRAMTSLRTRVKRDASRHQTEGDEDGDSRLPGVDIYNIGDANGPKVVNQSTELMQALKTRSSSNGKRPSSKITIVTIKKGRKGV